jgi:hypothetical protein
MKYASVDTYGSTDIDFNLSGFYTYLGEEKRIRENIFLILYFSLYNRSITIEGRILTLSGNVV